MEGIERLIGAYLLTVAMAAVAIAAMAWGSADHGTAVVVQAALVVGVNCGLVGAVAVGQGGRPRLPVLRVAHAGATAAAVLVGVGVAVVGLSVVALGVAGLVV